ncbi:MAG: acyl-CoA reductase [Saprospiraceae bacterium]|nr:acyl-CoA reductase [Saprospiraceae bacterium]
MRLSERIDALAELGKRLSQPSEQLDAVMHHTQVRNPWFTVENQKKAVSEIAKHFLQKDLLENWVKNYKLTESGLTIGLVLAGNIPLVGFHDILCVFVSGNKAKIKISDKDPFLLPYLLRILAEIDSRTADFFDITEGYLKGFDAVIATGSNNSARYFEAYFSKYPHIIRKNRNAVAILRGTETAEDLYRLGEDVFTYFGLGCRNVSKIYVPMHYNFNPLLEALHEFKDIVLHDKYKNNFDYNFTLLILNKIKHEANGCILMRESTDLASPIAVLFYEYYSDLTDLKINLWQRREEIQLIVAKEKVEGLPTFAFGEAQKPSLSDYADGVDTMLFLSDIQLLKPV